jgi:hypothetical protein
VPEVDENPVVKLPEKANHTTQRLSLDDDIPPLSVIVQPPTSSFPDSEPALTDSDVLKPRQFSVMDHLSELASLPLPKLVVSQHASSVDLCHSKILLFYCSYGRSLTSLLAQGSNNQLQEQV